MKKLFDENKSSSELRNQFFGMITKNMPKSDRDALREEYDKAADIALSRELALAHQGYLID